MATIFIDCRASWLYSSTRDCSVISRRTFTCIKLFQHHFFSVIRSTGLLPEYLLSILFPASYGRRALLPAHNCSSRAILTCSAVFISYTASLRDRFVSYRRIHTDARAPPCVIVYWCVVSGLNCLSLLRFGGWSTPARLHDAGAPRVPPPVKGDAFCRGPPSTSTEFTGMK